MHRFAAYSHSLHYLAAYYVMKYSQLHKYSTIVQRELARNVRVEKYLEEASVYIHYPYCKNICSYCAFNKYVPDKSKPWTIDEERLENAMVSYELMDHTY